VTAIAWILVTLGVAAAAARRRTQAVALVAIQAAVLGGAALVHGWGDSTALAVAGAVLVVRAVLLPVVLGAAISRTREPVPAVGEGTALGRTAVALAVAGGAAALAPALGVEPPAAGSAAVALVFLGAATAVLRGGAVHQALGFVVAESGVYLAALGAHGGVPPVVELGIAVDLTLVVAVAAVFGARLHAHHGSADTRLLRGLRD